MKHSSRHSLPRGNDGNHADGVSPDESLQDISVGRRLRDVLQAVLGDANQVLGSVQGTGDFARGLSDRSEEHGVSRFSSWRVQIELTVPFVP